MIIGAARPVVSDLLQNMRFHVRLEGGSTDRLAYTRDPYRGPEAGFSTCTAPEITVDVIEYREGQYQFTRMMPGIPKTTPVTLTRGVARLDSRFWDWMYDVINGSASFRETVEIHHFHRQHGDKETDGALAGKAQTGAYHGQRGELPKYIYDPTKQMSARTYRLHQAFPVRHKVAGDMDATSGDISIMELDLAYERMEVSPSEATGGI